MLTAGMLELLLRKKAQQAVAAEYGLGAGEHVSRSSLLWFNNELRAELTLAAELPTSMGR